MPPRFGPGNGKDIEKSKDFFGTIKRLIKDLKKFHLLLVIAIVLATISSIFSIIAPDKLSELTDEITKGITPNITEEKINEIMTNPDISLEDKDKFSKLLSSAKDTDNKSELLSKISYSNGMYLKSLSSARNLLQISWQFGFFSLFSVLNNLVFGEASILIGKTSILSLNASLILFIPIILNTPTFISYVRTSIEGVP